jgi:hypothetical protein
MELEAVCGSALIARAEEWFVCVVQDELPENAFSELNSVSREGVPTWATKWRVHAPCVLELGYEICNGNWEPGLRVSTYHGPHVPREWSQRLYELNAVPIESIEIHDVLSVMTEGERRAELGRLLARGRQNSLAEQQRIWTLRHEVPALQRQVHDAALPAIGANPLRESFDDFQKRTRVHWDARVREAEQRGYARVGAKSELHRDFEWLIRYQLRGESYEKIAVGPPAHTTDAVRMAIGRLAQLLRLQLRRDYVMKSRIPRQKRVVT